MKTKNCKVRTKDIRAGVTIYTGHPVYGIRTCVVTSKPYMERGIGLFFKSKVRSEYGDYISSHSICDDGIKKGESYNYRRTFFKLKQAKEWCKKMRTDPGFIKNQQKHEESCARFEMSYF
jgi:hypothetical protein